MQQKVAMYDVKFFYSLVTSIFLIDYSFSNYSRCLRKNFGCNHYCHWLCTAIDCNLNLITAIWLYIGCGGAVFICSVVTNLTFDLDHYLGSCLWSFQINSILWTKVIWRSCSAWLYPLQRADRGQSLSTTGRLHCFFFFRSFFLSWSTTDIFF